MLHTAWERSLGHRHVLLSMVSNHTQVLSLTLSASMAGGPLQPSSANDTHLQLSSAHDTHLHSSSAGACQCALWLQWYKSQVEKSSCSLNYGIMDSVEEMEKMSHQRGWSEILCECFSSWRSQLAALSTRKFCSS